ncbi:hypothetical protein B0T22DRAFT_512636 [Podospora appendiculata]|uniref:DUF7779 domain-containing protein n=1 Tax=Podospora appendiculata TaxID=314037 RepID=A0AAE1CCN2_9PEZI|nr:hypothetical protein B0T22DRAFT_512636 [Podospora appendiculata]
MRPSSKRPLSSTTAMSKGHSSWRAIREEGGRLEQEVQRLPSATDGWANILMGDGLGGLLIKQAIIRFNRDQWSKMSGVIFIATPQAIMADSDGYRDMVSYLKRVQPLFTTRLLNHDNMMELQNICREFKRLVQLNTSPVHFLSIAEGKAPSSWLGKTKAVDMAYAKLELDRETTFTYHEDIARMLLDSRADSNTVASRSAAWKTTAEFCRAAADTVAATMSPISLPTSGASSSVTPIPGSSRHRLGSPMSSDSFQIIRPPSLGMPSSTTDRNTEVLDAGSFSSFSSDSSIGSLSTARTPLFWLNDREPNKRFFQRAEILWQVHSFLSPDDGPAPAALKSCVLHGPHGIGKTELAIAYADQRRHSYDAVFLLSAVSPESLAKDYCLMAEVLGFSTAEAAAHNPSSSQKKVLSWLRRPVIASPAGGPEKLAKWLLILDNLDDLSHDMVSIVPRGFSGSLLITSVHPLSTLNEFFDSTGLEVPFLSSAEATDFIRFAGRRSPNDAEFDELETGHALEVAKRIGGEENTPFILGIVAGILSSSTQRKEDLEDVVQSFLDTGGLGRLFKKEVKGYMSHRYGHSSIASAWALNKVEPDRQKLLEIFATLDYTSIPGSLFIHVPWNNAEPPKIALVASRGDWYQALTDLEYLSLVTRSENRGLRIHRIVRDCIFSTMQESATEIEEAFTSAVKLLKQAWPYALGTGVGEGHDNARWTQCLLVYPHVLALMATYKVFQDQLKDNAIIYDFVGLLNEASWYNYQLGRNKTAFEIIDDALAFCSHTSVDTFRLRSDMTGTRTNLSTGMSDPLVSLAYGKAWIDLESARYDETKAVTAQLAAAHNSYGTCLAYCARYDEARHHLGQSKLLRESLPGFKPSQNWSPLYYLGVTAWLQGSHEEARGFLEQALRDREDEYGPEDKVGMRCGMLHLALGNVYWSLGKSLLSSNFHQKALVQLTETVGREHHFTAHAQYKVACHLLRNDKAESYREALELLKDASNIYATNEGLMPHEARCLYQAGEIYRKLGKKETSLKFQFEAVQKLKQAPLFQAPVLTLTPDIAAFDAVIPGEAR